MSIPPSTVPNAFSRYTHPDPATNRIVQDLYDKLQQIQQGNANTNTALGLVKADATALAQAASASGGSSGASSSLDVVQVPVLPDNNPSNSPLDKDGNLVFLAQSALGPGSLYRYDGADFQWTGPILGGVLLDTLANQANYAAGNYPEIVFLASDTLQLYVSNGTTWVLTQSIGGVNAQTGNYLLTSGDSGKLVTLNGSSLTATLPSPPPRSDWFVFVQNLNASALTISRNSLLINSLAANLTLQQYQWTLIFTNGTNYFAWPPVTLTNTLVLAEATKTSAYTVLPTDFLLIANITTGQTFTLPDATTVPGQVFAFKNAATSSANLSLAAVGGQKIDNSSASPALLAKDAWIIQSDAANWQVISKYQGTKEQFSGSTSVLTLSTSFQDVPDGSLIMIRTGTWLITGVFQFEVFQDSSLAVGILVASGVTQTGQAVASCGTATATDNITVQSTQNWIVTAGLGDVVKLRAKVVSLGAGNSVTGGLFGQSSITAVFLHD